jgi:phasin protein
MRIQAAKQGAVPATVAPTDTTTREAGSDRYARLVALQNDNVDALVRLHSILRDGAAEWSSDLLDFAGRHFQRQSNGASWQINSADPLETVTSHLRYCQGFAEECLEQTARFLNLAAKISRDSRAHLENHAAAMLSHLGRDDESLGLQESNAHAPSSRAIPDDRRNRP